MAIDVSHDFGAFDQPESIVFIRAQPAGEQSYPVALALRRPLTAAELKLLTSDLTLTSDDVAWHLPASALLGVLPQPGDRLIAGAETWLVVAAARVTLGTRWRLICRRTH